MNESTDHSDSGWAGMLGPVYDRVIPDADVYLAGLDDVILEGVEVTIRESAGVPGWVGVVDADLTPYKDFKLELRVSDERVPCGIMFTVGGGIFGRTLIRGSGPTPGEAPSIRTRPRIAQGRHLSSRRQDTPSNG